MGLLELLGEFLLTGLLDDFSPLFDGGLVVVVVLLGGWNDDLEGWSDDCDVHGLGFLVVLRSQLLEFLALWLFLEWHWCLLCWVSMVLWWVFG